MRSKPLSASPVLPIENSRIQLLDSQTVNQIAAGEVVERPASVVKELLENAIDSGATRIVLELENAGIGLIRVSDNGCGMTLEEAKIALQRHATSKIRSASDLSTVQTLGFRGEAIPSIASVSRISICTGTEDGSRVKIEVEGGKLVSTQVVAGSKGTEVSVEDLFFNTPARLKFLKSNTTELGQCVEMATRYAISYCHVAIQVLHDGNELFASPGTGDLQDALCSVWNRDLARALAPVDMEIAGIRVYGYASPPHITKPTRSLQYIFVNGRPVKSRTLTASLDQAYRAITPERRFPVLALHLEVDPTRIDVNVSPTKSEVKFEQEGAAFDALRYAIRQALLDYGMIPSADGIAAANEALASAQPEMFSHMMPMGMPAQGMSAPFIEAFQRPESPLATPYESATAPSFGDLNRERYPFADLLDGMHVLGQIMNTFIIAENRRGLVIIDQHVAHERVLYEYLCGLRGPSAIEIQRLLVPETIQLDRRSAVLVTERLEELRDVGFDIEPFGGDSFVVRAAPAALRGKSPVKVLHDLVDELVEVAVTRKLSPTREQIWITTSCKMAIKAGDPLSIAEMEKLIADLATTENPYLCPHGRPITVTLGADELLRKFKRT